MYMCVCVLTGGNSKTAMIAALSPADINYEETLSTLRSDIANFCYSHLFFVYNYRTGFFGFSTKQERDA